MDNNLQQPIETPESGEGSEQSDAQKINDATYEPGALIEQTGDYKIAEFIHTDFTTVMGRIATDVAEPAVAPAESIPVTPVIQPGEADVACDGASKEPPSLGEVAVPLKTTGKILETIGPVTPSIEGFLAIPEPIPTPAEGVAAIPEPIPAPVEDISAIPEPIPTPVSGVAAIPESIPSPAEGVSDLPEPMPSPVDGISISPVPQPVPEPGEGVSTLPMPIPSPLDGISISPVPQPVPEPGEGVSTLPVPIPSPLDGISISPVPQPVPEPVEGVSTLPTPLPSPLDGISISPVPQPVPDPGDEVSLADIPEGISNILDFEPQEGPFNNPPGGDDGDNITPINLPNIQDVLEGKVVSDVMQGIPEMPLQGLDLDATVKITGEQTPSPLQGPEIQPTPLPEQGGEFSSSPVPQPVPEPSNAEPHYPGPVPPPGAGDEILQVNIPEGIVDRPDLQPQEGPFSTPIGEIEGENVTPINLPNVRDVLVGKVVSDTGGELLETPLQGLDVESILWKDPSLWKESGEISETPLPGSGMEMMPEGSESIETMGTIDRLIENTLLGLEDSQAFEQTYPLPDGQEEGMNLYPVAAATLTGELVPPGGMPTPMPDTGEPPPIEMVEGMRVEGQPAPLPTMGEVLEPLAGEFEAVEGEQIPIPPGLEVEGNIPISGEAETPPVIGVPIEGVMEMISEAEEVWNPPEMLVYMGKNGMVVVDPSGKAVDSPPLITASPTGQLPYYAYYPGFNDADGNPIKFEIKEYKVPIGEIYYYTDGKGDMYPVDANGKAIESPPLISPSPTGSLPYYAYYQGDYGTENMVQVEQYKASLENIYYHDDGQGNLTVVDVNGKPIESPPLISPSPTGSLPYYAYNYGDYNTENKVEITQYKAPLENIYYYKSDEGMTVVDANGKPVTSPPVVSTGLTGALPYYAYNAGDFGTGNMVEIQAYKGPLENIYYSKDIDGKMIVVDADGYKVETPPYVSPSPTGSLPYYAYYEGDYGTDKAVVIQSYVGSLEDVYLASSSDGKPIVVDSSGKALEAQPNITSSEGLLFFASYTGNWTAADAVQLKPYHPPSSTPPVSV